MFNIYYFFFWLVKMGGPKEKYYFGLFPLELLAYLLFIIHNGCM